MLRTRTAHVLLLVKFFNLIVATRYQQYLQKKLNKQSHEISHMKIQKMKGFTYYSISQINFNEIKSAIENKRLVPLIDGQTFTSGFSPIEPSVSENLTLETRGRLFFNYIEQSKSISHSAFQHKVNELCEKYQLEHQSASEIPEEIKLKFEEDTRKFMLSFAPVKTKSCKAYLDPVCNRMVVLTTSQSLADQVVHLLFSIRVQAEHLRMQAPEKNYMLKDLFTQWVRASEAPNPCALDQRVVIDYPDKGKATIQNRHIANEEISKIVQNGTVCEVGLALLQKSSQIDGEYPVEFSWTLKGQFKAIRYDLLHNALWEQTLSMDETIQLQSLYYLYIEIVEEILAAAQTMLENDVQVEQEQFSQTT